MDAARYPHLPDDDLLLYAHGLLPLWRRLRVAGHLGVCQACRARAETLGRASRIAAGALSDPADPRPWTPAPPPGPLLSVVAVLLATWPGRLLLLLVVAVLLSAGVQTVRVVVRLRAATTAATPAAARGDEPCRPGLPSDRCR